MLSYVRNKEPIQTEVAFMEAIRKEIENIQQRMEWKQKDLDKEVKEFNEYAAQCNSYQIVTFLPVQIKYIEGLRNQLERLAEQKEMLEYLIIQMEV